MGSEIETNSFWRSTATATVGTAAQYTLVHPIWSAKVSAQSVGGEPVKLRIRNLPLLYRGYSLHVARALPVAAVQVVVGDQIKSRNAFVDPNLNLFFSGFIGGVVSGPLVTMTDAIMTQQKQQGGNAFFQAGQIYSRQGLRGFGIGLTATSLRNGGRAVSYFAAFPVARDVSRDLLANYGCTDAQQMFFANTFATATAGMFAAVVTNPPDAIKTVQQVALLQANRASELTVRGAIKSIYQSKGWMGFFSGLQHRLASRGIEVFVMGQALTHVPGLIDSFVSDDDAPPQPSPRPRPQR